MKQIELNLQKRLLIVELSRRMEYLLHKDELHFLLDGILLHEIKYGKFELICKGFELTEEIASTYVENFCANMNIPAYRNYAVKPEDLEDDHWAHVANDALESFISAIEVNNMFWGNNNIPYPSIYDPRSKTGRYEIGEELNKAELEYKKAESKTFNPEKTLIFEILL